MIEIKDPRPVYFQIARVIKNELGMKYKHGQRLLSENELAYYRASRVTIRNALPKLNAHNLVYRLYGKGIFETPSRIESMSAFASFAAKCTSPSMKGETKVLDRKAVKNLLKYLAKNMQFAESPQQQNGFITCNVC